MTFGALYTTSVTGFRLISALASISYEPERAKSAGGSTGAWVKV
jgi:hypothetical protein